MIKTGTGTGYREMGKTRKTHEVVVVILPSRWGAGRGGRGHRIPHCIDVWKQWVSLGGPLTTLLQPVGADFSCLSVLLGFSELLRPLNYLLWNASNVRKTPLGMLASKRRLSDKNKIFNYTLAAHLKALRHKNCSHLKLLTARLRLLLRCRSQPTACPQGGGGPASGAHGVPADHV